ncbi:MAG: alpha/beta fold hydrolase [Candidatus Eremiobacteraeota bacterium]|nr:alpha/beta fold hydrolase [Candidatus Eremiobacteraeota bacterium]
MNGNAIHISALDGYALPATIYQPQNAATAAIIVSPATATPRRFYRAFCEYLASRGAVAVTYDYRGTFEPPAVLRHSKARMRDWGELDFPGVVDWLAARYPSLPVYTVGHSVGGHVLLMTDRASKIQRAVTVASQSGYWRLYRGFERYRVYAFVKAIMPAVTRAFGYFPGERLVFGTNLAPGVLYEWSRWCTSRGYFFDDRTMDGVLARAASFCAPVTMIGMTDDPWATTSAIDALVPGFLHATVARRELHPQSYGLRAVGHMGFFRAANATLWNAVDEALHLNHSKEYA